MSESPPHKRAAHEEDLEVASPGPAARKQAERKSGKAFLQSVTLGDLVKWKVAGKKQPLLNISIDASVRDAMLLMSQHNVLSLPVWDPAQSQYVCFLSVVDVLRFCMAEAMNTTTEGASRGNDEILVRHVVKEIEVDEETQVEVWSQSDHASQVMEWFTLGIHRVLVADETAAQSPANQPPAAQIISQSDVVRYLFEHVPDMGSLVSTSVEQSGFIDADAPTIGATRLEPITTDVTALQGFQKLFFDRTSAVPIVDSEGKLVANLSASDLRGITAEQVDTLLLLPVLEFLSQRRSIAPFTCLPSATLHQVMKNLVEHNAHRLWVVNDQRKLLGVITLTDLLCKFAPFDYKLLHSTKI